jgi:hypothetical protein
VEWYKRQHHISKAEVKNIQIINIFDRMIKSIFYISAVLGVLQSCTPSDKERKSLLPLSSGELTELVLLTDAASLDSAYKLEIESVFSKSIIGQPPPGEPMFNVLFTDESFFSGYFRKHLNILVLVHRDKAEGLKKVMSENLINKILEVQSSKPGILGVKQSELYAQNQNVFFLLADNKTDMQIKLKAKKDEILAIAIRQENEAGKRKLLGTKRAKQDVFYQKSIAKRGFGVRKPGSYRVAIDNDEFAWLRKSSTTQEKEMGILLFEAPYVSKDDLTTENLLKIRNSYTKKYIPGQYDSSYMKYSTVLPPVRIDQNFKSKYGVEINGWWDVEGDFMGGPSYIRAVVDEKNARIVFAEGFLFYPNEDKAKPLRELKILVNTLSIK